MSDLTLVTLERQLLERLPTRIFSKFTVQQLKPDRTPCWVWQKALTDNGYARIRDRERNNGVIAHRYIYKLLIGPIDDGLDLDHLCRVRRCVNPMHLEPVTRKVNVARGDGARRTHCLSGHRYTAANTYATGKGSQDCRRCAVIDQARRYEERKERWKITRVSQLEALRTAAAGPAPLTKGRTPHAITGTMAASLEHLGLITRDMRSKTAAITADGLTVIREIEMNDAEKILRVDS